MVVTYTTANDVGNKLGFPASYFTTISTPTLAQVETFINRAEDTIDITTGHAWRSVTVANEYVRPSSIYRMGTGIRLKLQHRSVSAITKLEIWDGSNWIDYVTTKTEGRNDDYWYDASNGLVFLVSTMRIYPHGVRVSYTYGESAVPGDINDCAAMMVALSILNAPEFNAVLFTQAGETTPMRDGNKKIWRDMIDTTLYNRAEFQ